MFVLEVIPISGNAHKETLTYFTKEDIKLGSIIKVPLRSKRIPALVVGSNEARSIKSAIKNADFELRKIETSNEESVQFFSPEFIQAVIKSADYFATTSGAILNTVVGQAIFTQILPKAGNATSPSTIAKIKMPSKTPRPSTNTLAIQGSEQDRLSSYKSRIRQAFASKQSVIVCVPTTDYADYIKMHLAKGLEDFTIVLHGGLTPKKFATAWQTIHKTKHPMLTITTAPYLPCLRADTAVIILEQEHHRAYKTLRRPYMDLRFFIEALAKAYDFEFIIGDLYIRPETHVRIEATESGSLPANNLVSGFLSSGVSTSSPFSWRINSTATTELIDMKQYKSKGENKSFRILADSTTDLIKRTKEESEHMIILAVRRGLAPQTVCADCQTIVICKNCSAPVVLHASKSAAKGVGTVDGNQYFLCHKCGDKRSADETCKNCNSWNLGVIGIGIDLVEEKIRSNFPDINLIRIDSDTTPNVTTLRKALEEFRNRPGSIILGTEMMLSYLHEPVGYSAVISLDSLFSLPDFRIGEKIIHILGNMRSLTTNKMIVQTRKPEEKVLDFGLKGNLSQYYEYEIAERKAHNQPPFYLHVKITIEGERNRISEEMHKLRSEIENVLSEIDDGSCEFDIFPAFTHTVRGDSVLHGLVKIPPSKWPHQKLLTLLRSLPLHYTVKVDPDSLL